MKTTLAALLGAALLAACGTAETARDGNPAQHAAIEASTDCAELQRWFDENEAWSQRRHAKGETADEALAHLSHANDRMEEVGCYS